MASTSEILTQLDKPPLELKNLVRVTTADLLAMADGNTDPDITEILFKNCDENTEFFIPDNNVIIDSLFPRKNKINSHKLAELLNNNIDVRPYALKAFCMGRISHTQLIDVFYLHSAQDYLCDADETEHVLCFDYAENPKYLDEYVKNWLGLESTDIGGHYHLIKLSEKIIHSLQYEFLTMIIRELNKDEDYKEVLRIYHHASTFLSELFNNYSGFENLLENISRYEIIQILWSIKYKFGGIERYDTFSSLFIQTLVSTRFDLPIIKHNEHFYLLSLPHDTKIQLMTEKASRITDNHVVNNSIELIPQLFTTSKDDIARCMPKKRVTTLYARTEGDEIHRVESPSEFEMLFHDIAGHTKRLVAMELICPTSVEYIIQLANVIENSTGHKLNHISWKLFDVDSGECYSLLMIDKTNNTDPIKCRVVKKIIHRACETRPQDNNFFDYFLLIYFMLIFNSDEKLNALDGDISNYLREKYLKTLTEQLGLEALLTAEQTYEGTQNIEHTILTCIVSAFPDNYKELSKILNKIKDYPDILELNWSSNMGLELCIDSHSTPLYDAQDDINEFKTWCANVKPTVDACCEKPMCLVM